MPYLLVLTSAGSSALVKATLSPIMNFPILSVNTTVYPSSEHLYVQYSLSDRIIDIEFIINVLVVLDSFNTVDLLLQLLSISNTNNVAIPSKHIRNTLTFIFSTLFRPIIYYLPINSYPFTILLPLPDIPGGSENQIKTIFQN